MAGVCAGEARKAGFGAKELRRGGYFVAELLMSSGNVHGGLTADQVATTNSDADVTAKVNEHHYPMPGNPKFTYLPR